MPRCSACLCAYEHSCIKCAQRPTEAHARRNARAHAHTLMHTGIPQDSEQEEGARDGTGASGGTLSHGEAVHHRGVGTTLLVDVHGDAKVHRCDRKIERSPCFWWLAGGRSRALARAFYVVLGCTSANGRRAGACVPACGLQSSAQTAGSNRRSLRGRAGYAIRAAQRGLGAPLYAPEHTATDGEHHVTLSDGVRMSQSPPSTSGYNSPEIRYTVFGTTSTSW